jgi:uncharacterized membrane protein YoaK (UPF0700 family)
MSSRQAGFRDAAASPPSIDYSFLTKLLAFVLSVIAGSTDIIGFLGLDGLFTAHITGNLVILAARFFGGGPAPVAHLISVPVFIVAVLLTRLLAGILESTRIGSPWPLLLLQFLLLAAFLAIGVAAGPRVDPNAPMMIFAGMLGVSAMAVQNALARILLTGAPSTAVMTTNITVFTLDVGETLVARDTTRIAEARRRAKHTWPAIAGFLLGCALGAPFEVALGLRSLVLPAGLALVAVALGVAASLHPAERSPSVHKERRTPRGRTPGPWYRGRHTNMPRD